MPIARSIVSPIVSGVTSPVVSSDWWEAGSVIDLDFANRRYMRDGSEMLESEFNISNDPDFDTGGLLVDGNQVVWLDVSMSDLEAAGTVVFKAAGGASISTAARMWSLSLSNSNGNDYVFSQLFAAGAKISSRYRADAGAIIAPGVFDFVTEADFTHATSWDADDIRHSMNEAAALVAAIGTALNANTLNRLYIGNNFSGTTPLDGRVRRLTIYPTKTL